MNEIELKIVDNHDDFAYLCKIIEDSFPKEEYRPFEELKSIWMHNANFTAKTIVYKGERIGIITSWNFDQFIYIEHFAISEFNRGNGCGGDALDAFTAQCTKPIILECEIPVTNIAQRRISFYERHGFSLWSEFDYLQPPYRKGDEYFPLKLMCKGDLTVNADSEIVKSEIYKNVYRVTTD